MIKGIQVLKIGFDVEKIDEEIQNDIVEAIDDISIKIRNEAKRIARSFKTATGDLGDHIWAYLNKEELYAYVNVYKQGSMSDEEFQQKIIKSISIEFGHVTRSFQKGAQTSEGQGLAKSRKFRAAHKEVPAQPYIRPAYDKYKGELLERLSKYVQETIADQDGK